jgi:hypothetical protein
LSQNEEDRYLLLVEAGAEVPGWLDLAKVDRLDQRDLERHVEFVERSVRWLRTNPMVNTVVVALRIAPAVGLEERVHVLGTNLVAALDGRPKARLLFGAPADSPERQRRRLLGLAAALAQNEEGQRPCIVGAHFEANSPSSSKIPVLSS